MCVSPAAAQIIGAPLQRELILVLPDLVTDDQHPAAVDMLCDLMRKDTKFTAPVLDSLGSLQLNNDLQTRVSEFILDSVASADAADLPVVIRAQRLLDSEKVNELTW